jgi:hypothetical protein
MCCSTWTLDSVDDIWAGFLNLSQFAVKRAVIVFTSLTGMELSLLGRHPSP